VGGGRRANWRAEVIGGIHRTVSIACFDTNSRESTLFPRPKSCVEGTGGLRLPAQRHSPCEIHRRQRQAAQVSEVGEFLPASTPRGLERAEHSEEEPQQSRGQRPRRDLRESGEKKPGLRPGPGRVRQPGLRPGPALAGLARPGGREQGHSARPDRGGPAREGPYRAVGRHRCSPVPPLAVACKAGDVSMRYF